MKLPVHKDNTIRILEMLIVVAQRWVLPGWNKALHKMWKKVLNCIMISQPCNSGRIKGVVLISKYMVKKYGFVEATLRILKRKVNASNTSRRGNV
jgi:hypothetical protein